MEHFTRLQEKSPIFVAFALSAPLRQIFFFRLSEDKGGRKDAKSAKEAQRILSGELQNECPVSSFVIRH